MTQTTGCSSQSLPQSSFVHSVVRTFERQRVTETGEARQTESGRRGRRVRGEERQRQTDRDRQTERQTDRQTDRQAGRQTGRQADRQTETDRQRQRQTETHTQRQTKIETKESGQREKDLLHKDKDLNTIRLFCKFVPDDKHSKTQYIKQEYNELCGKKHSKTKRNLISV